MSDEQQKLVVISDVHVHPWSMFADGDGIENSRLQQTLRVLENSLDYAERTGAVWLCAGDLFHTTGHARNAVLNALYDTLSQYDGLLDMYVVWGNHDSRGSGYAEVTEEETALTTLADAIGSLHLLNKEQVELQDGLTLYGAGAQANEKWLDYGPGGNIGMFHGIVDGTETPSGHELDGEIDPFELADRYTLSVVGDVHHPQARYLNIREEAGRTILVPGAPEHHNFGDKGKRGWWEVDFKLEDGEWTPYDLTRHESESPKFLTVDSAEEVQDDGNFYRVMGEVNPEDVPGNATAIGSPPATVENRDAIPLGADETEVLGAWMDEDPPPEDVDREKLLKAGRELLDDADLSNLKNIRLLGAHGHDFFSYKEFNYDVQDGVTLVTGRSNDFDSNGAGKTTLFEAIYWALFGRTTKGTQASDVIRWGADDCAVELHFVVGGDTPAYIRRERDERSIHVEAAIDGEPVRGETNRATEQRFRKFLGITEDIFRALAYKSQKDVLLLTQATDAERKDVLAELVGLSAYQEASTKAGQKSREAEDKFNSARDKLETLSESLESMDQRIEEAEEKAGKWDQKQRTLINEAEADLMAANEKRSNREDELVERIARLEERATNLLDIWRERHEAKKDELAEARAESERRKLNKRIKRTRERIEDIDTSGDDMAHADMLPELQSELEDLREAKSAANDEVIEARAKVTRLDEKFGRAKHEVADAKSKRRNKAGAKCPECGQDVDEDHFDDLIKEKEEKVARLEERVDEAQERLDKARARHQDIHEEIDDVERQIESGKQGKEKRQKIKSAKERIEELESDLEDVEDKAHRDAEKEVQRRIDQTNDRLAGYLGKARAAAKDELSELEQQVREAKLNLKSEKSKENPHRETLSTLGEEYDTLVQRAANTKSIKNKARRKMDLYEYWKHGFSKQGVQSLLLEEVASEFNRVRQEIFPLLTRSTYDVQFSTISETQAGEKREKTEFVIRYGDREVDYDQLSGGQQRRIDVGVMLAITVANARMRGVPGVLGVLILDEVFDFLDDDGKEAVAETLQAVTDTIPAAYVVTQDDDMKAHFSQIMQVEQDNQGISKITQGGKS